MTESEADEIARSVPRAIGNLAEHYITSFRVVILNGPRQAGKTTIMRQLRQRHGGDLRNLDEEALLAAARADPAGFVVTDTCPLMIDEVQRAGDPLIRAIKARVDQASRPGQFVLAGSMRFLSVPTLTESLAGRSGVLEIWPFSQGELAGTTHNFLDVAFEDPDSLRRADSPGMTRGDYLQRLEIGGFPEPSMMTSRRSRSAWFANYAAAVTHRDIREMARVNEPSAAATVLRALACLTGQLLLTTKVADRAGLPRATVERYIGLLETVFLAFRLPPWSRNLLAQAVKHPKVHLVDTGLACHLVGANEEKLARPNHPALGGLVETFLVTEIAKQATWADHQTRLYHFRDHRGSEVDLIIEDEDGTILGLEAKAALTVTDADFKHLRGLQTKLGDQFRHGYVAYFGDRVLTFGSRLTAIPMGLLWTLSR